MPCRLPLPFQLLTLCHKRCCCCCLCWPVPHRQIAPCGGRACDWRHALSSWLQLLLLDSLHCRPDRYVPLFGASSYDVKLERKDDISFEEQLRGLEQVVKSGKVRRGCRECRPLLPQAHAGLSPTQSMRRQARRRADLQACLHAVIIIIAIMQCG